MLWIDTDMGFDDMHAILMVEQSGFDIAGISLVFGNSTLDQVRRNAAAAVSFFGWKMPVYTGAASAVLGHVETPAHVLGPTGIPTLGQSLPEASPLPDTSAVGALADWLEGVRDAADILALGPLTNIAILCLSRPDLLPKIKTLTWMGGSAGRGNHTPSAEFNAYADPEAVAIALASNLRLRIVDLEACRQVLVTPEDLDELRRMKGPRGTILADLAGAYVDIAIQRGRPAMALYDPTAAAAVVLPKALTFAAAHVEMELGGAHSRGRTIVDQRAGIVGNANLCGKVDANAVRSLALGALIEAAR